MRLGCPPPAAASQLELARPEETYGRQPTIMARREALAAYRSMLAAARAEVPAIRSDPEALTIVSAFRAPQADGGDCPAGQACFNLTRAACSVHRTGRAFDLYLGAAPGRDPTSTADDNRLYQARTPAYRWLVRHAAQFGFLPYAYEPWHWEWTAPPSG
jgi:LAS superfamily LD-carboxypeptidase LdcB